MRRANAFERVAVSLVSLGGPGELGELLNYWKQIARTLGGPCGGITRKVKERKNPFRGWGYVCLERREGRQREEKEAGRAHGRHGSSHQRVVLIESLRGVCSSLLI